MAVILISGGTGLVGNDLSRFLINNGHEVRVLSRNKTSTIKNQFHWNVLTNEIDEKAFDGIEHIIHLAGSGIADKRWTIQRKKDILDSRVNSMKLITQVVKRKNIKLKSFVGASAIGIYGMQTSTKVFAETDTGIKDFLSETCIAWEKSYSDIENYTEKLSIIRIGVVLSKNGGALQKLIPLFKLGLGSAVGSGKQFMPWIHIDDLVSVFDSCLFKPNFKGIYNAVTSEKTTNSAFSQILANTLHKPFFMPKVPAFILKLLLGKMSGIVLEGSQVSNAKLIYDGFIFQFNTAFSALKNIFNVK